ncbi:hypothetical protein K438DRAFT_1787644 [Mycena galopus ATCC 62051]|nr:hypothetical protein K438DRAFT_1787644 [Mycena galopus ATCC 62051]
MADSRGKSARLVANAYSPDGDSVVAEVSPVTSKPHKRGRTQSVSVDSQSGSDVESPPPKKPKLKQAKKTKEAVELDPDRKLVLMVPQATSEGTQRENLKHSTTFDEALVLIHETIGCTNVPKKPVLSYKLSNGPAKAPAINLGSASDWEGCLEEVTEAESKKNAKVSVVIIVVDIYMNSLRAKLGLKSAGAKPKKGKLPILDLEHAGSGDDDFDEGLGIMDKEVKCLEQLQNHHGRCQRCGPSLSCKIDRAGNHHQLTNPQMRGWARSLLQATGTHKVTLNNPPQDDLFRMFHKISATPTTAAPEHPTFPGMGQYMGYPFMPPWAMQGPPAAGVFSSAPVTPSPAVSRPSHTSHASTSTLPAFPSSDPPDMGALNPYTEIPEFIRQLHEYYPQRNLVQYIDRFGDLDYYNIDEIAKLGGPDNLVELIGITHGNAQLLEKIKAEMKRTDRAARN